MGNEPSEAVNQPAFCSQCKRITPHRHIHDTAHGIAETHMTGTERYECVYCRWSIHKEERGTINEHLRFVLD
jgi:hypothetical protein